MLAPFLGKAAAWLPHSIRTFPQNNVFLKFVHAHPSISTGQRSMARSQSRLDRVTCVSHLTVGEVGGTMDCGSVTAVGDLAERVWMSVGDTLLCRGFLSLMIKRRCDMCSSRR